MRFGFFIMPEPFPWSNWTVSYDIKLEEIVKAELYGFDEVWIGEHHTGAYENIPSPDLFIAKASALTSRIHLATGTISLPYHDPFLVAERMAFLDHLCHGRLIYGFGAGAYRRQDALPAPARRATPACTKRSTSSSSSTPPPTTSTTRASSGASSTAASRSGRTRRTPSSPSRG
jgi:hypothetical protein